MTGKPIKRKLVAILAMDAVGYSRLMAADEEGTARILAAHRAVIDGIIEFHAGRIIGTAGDSVLAEFDSPVEAVRCAVEVQDALKTRNHSLPEGERLQFRIGINLGDVMERDGDLLGDGVNIAARLEGIADPGGICVSSSVHEQIAGKLDLGFVDIGARSLKNIERPVQVYRVARMGDAVVPRPARSFPPALAWGLIGVAVLVAVAAGAWHGLAPRGDPPVEAVAERQRLEQELARLREDAARATQQAEAASAEARQAREQQRAAELRAEAARPQVPGKAAVAGGAPAPERREPVAPGQASREAAPGAGAQDKWTARISCEPFGEVKAWTDSLEVVRRGHEFVLERGQEGLPGALRMRGVTTADGALKLIGSGISAIPSQRGRPYPASFDGRFENGRYEAPGWLGRRACLVSLLPSP